MMKQAIREHRVIARPRHLLFTGTLAVSLALAAPLMLLPRSSLAEPASSDLPAREWMANVQRAANATTGVAEMRMSLIGPGGRTRHREATAYEKRRANGRMARLIRFHSPPEMAGAAVLALENVERDDDWWIYIPAYHTTRRIAPANRSDPYMGTDFSYEDLTDLRLDDYDFALMGWETIDGIPCRQLEARPANSAVAEASRYGRLRYWIDPDRWIYPRAVLYGHDGEPLKEVRNSQPITIDGQWRWSRTEMHGLRKDHRTILEIRERRIGEPLPERLFTERALRRPG
ncbi:MAG: outer membrane lipoprotein-sorting protein [Candidatus Eisenbacteria sp.]|nr:outer membrane lipoprotein-sorting protein [Candidatus Eisenbacteria bacterium]